MTNLFTRALGATTLSLLATGAGLSAQAQTKLELGRMWTFENPPLGYLEQEYGFKPSQEWMDSLRMASLRFGNWCSASFVSPKGLIMTNHHCVRDNIAQASPPDQDWVQDGFYAGSLEDEVRLQGLTVQQLAKMEDVTARMLEGIASGDDEAAAEEKRRTNEAGILAKAREDNPGLDPEIVTLHNGASYQLYLYKVYSDVRLVCAPHLQTGHYGGDPDNFTYPRFSLDFGFCRAYEDGKPADTSAHYFKWSKTGAVENDLVFVTGNPGSTGRLLTYAQMVHLRDTEYPLQLGLLGNRLNILRIFAEADPALGRRLKTIILGDENSVKALTGYRAGLLDDELMAQKAAFEEEFRGKVAADPKLSEQYGHVWDRLAEIVARKSEILPKAMIQNPDYQGHLIRATAIVNAVDPEVSEDERAMARQMAMQPVSFSPVRRALFIDHLARAQKWLPREDPYMAAILGDMDEASATSKLAASFVEDDNFVRELLDGGMEAVKASDDAAIVAALAIDPLMKANGEAMMQIEAQEAVLARQIGQALYACYGDLISPDATMTLRFSDGLVKGYAYNGTIAPYRTTFYGLYGRNVEFDNQDPFHLPQIWLDKKADVDLTKSVNFVSTNDIIGGNSGSPVVNQNLEVVGLIFDGNIEQLPNRFLFRDEVERSVSVHVEGIIEAMSKIYGADRIVDELNGK